MSSLQELLVDESCDGECRKTASVSDSCESSRDTTILLCRTAQSEDVVIENGVDQISSIKNDIAIPGSENISRIAFKSAPLDTKNENAGITVDSKQRLSSDENNVDIISNDCESTCEGGEIVTDSLIAELDNKWEPSTEPNYLVDNPDAVWANSPGLENQMSYQLLLEAGKVEVVENNDFIGSENVGQIRGSDDVFECTVATLLFTKDDKIVVDMSATSPEILSNPEIQGTAITSSLRHLQDSLPSLERMSQVKIKSLEDFNPQVEVPLNAEVDDRSKGENVEDLTSLSIKIEVEVNC